MSRGDTDRYISASKVADFAIARSHDSGYWRGEEIAATKERFGKDARDPTAKSKQTSNRARRTAAAEQEHSVRPQELGDLESDHSAEGRAAHIGRSKPGDIAGQSRRVIGK